jgi:hypothetical protein
MSKIIHTTTPPTVTDEETRGTRLASDWVAIGGDYYDVTDAAAAGYEALTQGPERFAILPAQARAQVMRATVTRAGERRQVRFPQLLENEEPEAGEEIPHRWQGE